VTKRKPHWVVLDNRRCIKDGPKCVVGRARTLDQLGYIIAHLVKEQGEVSVSVHWTGEDE